MFVADLLKKNLVSSARQLPNLFHLALTFDVQFFTQPVSLTTSNTKASRITIPTASRITFRIVPITPFLAIVTISAPNTDGTVVYRRCPGCDGKGIDLKTLAPIGARQF